VQGDLVPHIKLFCDTKDKENLMKVGVLLEQMLLEDDVKIREVANVSVLEPIVLDDRDIIICLREFLKEKTIDSLAYWENRYSY
jgi:hypothetical protein